MSKTLEQKNTRYLIMWLPVVLLLGSLLFFVMLNMHAHHTQEKLLELKQQNVWNAFIAGPAAMNMQIADEYVLMEGEAVPKKLLGSPRDTILDIPKNEKMNFRALTREYAWNDKTYQLTTFVSSNEFFHLTIKVFTTELLIFLLLLLAIVVINKKTSYVLWKPFYTTLSEAEKYDVAQNASIQLQHVTGTVEFDGLNSELSKLIEKVNNAYRNQKNFCRKCFT